MLSFNKQDKSNFKLCVDYFWIDDFKNNLVNFLLFLTLSMHRRFDVI